MMLVATFITLAAAPLVILFNWLLGKNIHKAARRVVYWYGSLVVTLLKPVMPVKMSGVNIASDVAPCIMVANHQSFLDMYTVSSQSIRDVVMVVQSWPFKALFFFAPLMRLAQYIETGAPENADLPAKCDAVFKQGASILCFAEGTRTRDGALLPFYTGIFRVALACNVPVVPVVFHNTGAVCPAGTFAARPKEVRISLLEPVFPASVQGLEKPHIRLREIVRTAINEALEKDSEFFVVNKKGTKHAS